MNEDDIRKAIMKKAHTYAEWTIGITENPKTRKSGHGNPKKWFTVKMLGYLVNKKIFTVKMLGYLVNKKIFLIDRDFSSVSFYYLINLQKMQELINVKTSEIVYETQLI